MPAIPTATTEQTKAGAAAAGKKILVACLVIPALAFIAIGISTMQAEQQTEQQRRGIAVVGGKSDIERHAPEWLQKIAGTDFHSFLDRTSLIKVTMAGEKIGDAELAKLAGLPEIRELNLRDSSITNEGLKTIAQLKSLRQLELRGTKISDVSPLAALPELEALSASFSEVRETNFESLQQFPKLRSFGAAGLKITDSGVAVLAKLSNLKALTINGAILSENGLQPLQGMKGLKVLSIKDCQCNPADVAALKTALPECKFNE